MMTVEQLDDLLAAAGVDLGKPDKRRERALRLLNEGCTAQDLDEMVSWAHATRRKIHTVGHWLEWATNDVEVAIAGGEGRDATVAKRWKATIDGIHALKAKRAADAAVTPSFVRQITPEEQEARKRGMVYARVVCDRADPDLVALELDITRPRLDEILAEEIAKRPAPPERKPMPRKLQIVKGEGEDEIW